MAYPGWGVDMYAHETENSLAFLRNSSNLEGEGEKGGSFHPKKGGERKGTLSTRIRKYRTCVEYLGLDKLAYDPTVSYKNMKFLFNTPLLRSLKYVHLNSMILD